MPVCLALSIIRLGSRVKWNNPGKEVAPSPTPQGSSFERGAFGSPSTKVTNCTYLFLYSFEFYLFPLFISFTLAPGPKILWKYPIQEEYPNQLNRYPDRKLNLMEGLQFRSSFILTLISDQPNFRVVVTVTLPSIGQIDLFKKKSVLVANMRDNDVVLWVLKF